MSVKVRLNNKKFLGGNSLLIGSHLYESKLFEGEVQQDANNGQGTEAQNGQQQQQVAGQQPAANSQQPQATAQTNASAPVSDQASAQTGNTETPNQAKTGDNQNQQSIAEQLTTVLTNGFKQFAETLKNQIASIKFPEGVQAQWKAPEAPKDETLQSQLDVLKGFIEANINVAKSVLEQQQKASQENANAKQQEKTEGQ